MINRLRTEPSRRRVMAVGWKRPDRPVPIRTRAPHQSRDGVTTSGAGGASTTVSGNGSVGLGSAGAGGSVGLGSAGAGGSVGLGSAGAGGSVGLGSADVGGSVGAAHPGTAVPPRRLPDWTLIIPPAVALAVTLWGLTARPYWGDEADTVSAISRSLPQLVRLLGHVDAVHGLYYLLMWPVAGVWGVSEFATRLPSVLAMAAAAWGVTVIGRRLGSRRVGLGAGLVFAILPMVSLQGHDARPYAIVTAVAVLATWQVLRAADDPRPLRFAAYALSLALLGYLELFAFLLVPAHAISLWAFTRRDPPGRRMLVLRRWAAAVAAAGAAVAPLVVWGWSQRAQIGWINRPGLADAEYLVIWLAAGSAVSAAVLGGLAVLGANRSDLPVRYEMSLAARAIPEGRALAWLAVPWLALPPVTLLAVSQFDPVYNFRYVVFCVPAVALLAGAGLDRLGRASRALALALVVALAVPAHAGMRVGGGGMWAVAHLLATHARPADAVIYPGGGIPPWYLAYPRAFGHLRNIGMSQSGAQTGRLYGTRVPATVLLRRESRVGRIWVIETDSGTFEPARDIAPGFTLVGFWQPDHTAPDTVWLYQRVPGAGR